MVDRLVTLRRLGLVVMIMTMAVLPLSAQRIVSVGGVVTETLFALGLGKYVVGVDVTSTYPASVHSLTNVGYFTALSTEGLLSLKPTHVVAIGEAGPPHVIEQLKAAGVKIVTVERPETIDETCRCIETIGASFAVAAKAKELTTKLRSDIAALRKEITAKPVGKRILFLYLRGRSVTYISGKGTVSDAMVQSVGATNAIDVKGNIAITAESVIGANPDIIVVTEHGAASVGGMDGVRALPGVAATRAGKARKIVKVDDALMLTFGPRLAEGTKTLYDLLRNAQ